MRSSDWSSYVCSSDLSEAVLSGQQHWQLQGRIALSLGDDGGSGRLLWQHDGADFSIQVSAPVSRQSWRLSTHGGWARLAGLDGGPREGADAQALLRESLGWDEIGRASCRERVCQYV